MEIVWGLLLITVVPTVVVMAWLYIRHEQLTSRYSRFDLKINKMQLEVEKEKIRLQILLEENKKLDKIIENRLEY